MRQYEDSLPRHHYLLSSIDSTDGMLGLATITGPHHSKFDDGLEHKVGTKNSIEESWFIFTENVGASKK